MVSDKRHAQAGVGVHLSAVQFEIDGIMHGLMANPDRKFVYGEMVRPRAQMRCLNRTSKG